MNPKDGMNTTKLKKLFKNSYLPLYPDIADEPGKRVLAKLDSGPGQKYAANTQARQEAISYSKTHGQIFHATGGQHITADDMFKGSDINNKKRQIEGGTPRF